MTGHEGADAIKGKALVDILETIVLLQDVGLRIELHHKRIVSAVGERDYKDASDQHHALEALALAVNIARHKVADEIRVGSRTAAERARP